MLIMTRMFLLQFTRSVKRVAYLQPISGFLSKSCM